jgi:hypothetical protein
MLLWARSDAFADALHHVGRHLDVGIDRLYVVVLF